MAKRRNLSAVFKAKAALEALAGEGRTALRPIEHCRQRFELNALARPGSAADFPPLPAASAATPHSRPGRRLRAVHLPAKRSRSAHLRRGASRERWRCVRCRGRGSVLSRKLGSRCGDLEARFEATVPPSEIRGETPWNMPEVSGQQIAEVDSNTRKHSRNERDKA